MGSQIDEFLAKKKEQTTLLDLHNCTANSKEELRKLVEKVPEFKIKPEKVLFYSKILLTMSMKYSFHNSYCNISVKYDAKITTFDKFVQAVYMG